MANSKIFCNVPWTNTHVYWDGSFGACCSEKHRPYLDEQWSTYNLSKMTVDQWHNSIPIKDLRVAITGDEKLSLCQGCYEQENVGYESRRIKENFKSVIFTEQAFDKSYRQSPWFDRFDRAPLKEDQLPPSDWHIDLGNECNLSCKMCRPIASSQLAAKYISWNIPFERRKNWTNDETSWNNFITSVDNSNINRLHFMGGEPLISKRLYQIVDYLLEKNRTDISVSFVSNGTKIDLELVDKLKQFRSCDIEISLESIDRNNDYIRQGLGNITETVKNNINILSALQTDNFKIVLRSVPQLLNINNYDQYIIWAWREKLAVQGIPLDSPRYLSIPVLPTNIRQSLIKQYQQAKALIQNEASRSFTSLATGRDTSRLDIQLIKECDGMINILNKPEPDDVHALREELARWLMRWDKEFDLNAYDFYPEYTDFLKSIGYEV